MHNDMSRQINSRQLEKVQFRYVVQFAGPEHGLLESEDALGSPRR